MPFFQCQNLRVLVLADDVVAIVLDCDNSKSNALTPVVMAELDDAVDRIAQKGAFRQVVICSAKSAGFAHGPDVTWLSEHARRDELVHFAEVGQACCQKLAALAVPSVAVIAGSCLGAGLELALACDYRIVVDRPGVVLGLTQVELGLVPCWGGTQRLPRLVGLENSLKLLASARRLRPAEALRIGLVDAICADEDADPPTSLLDPIKRDWLQRPQRNWRQRWLETSSLGRRLIMRGARRVLTERLPDDMPAPWEALEALRLAGEHADFAKGLEQERNAIALLAESRAFASLLWLRKERERHRSPPAESARFVRAIGVVGATEAGIALVQRLLLKGCHVVLHDADQSALGHAAFRLHQTLLQDEVGRGALSHGLAVKCLHGFRGTGAWERFDELDLVLDTIEDGERAARFRLLDGITAPATILAATGAVDTVATLREGLKHPHRVAVVHFAGPAGQETLAELAQPVEAAAPVQRRLEEWVASLGRITIPVRDCAGLLVQRIWLPAFNEAVLLLREGMQLARIDAAMDRFGASPGPLEMMDQIGLDAIARLVNALQPAFAGRIAVEAGFAEMARQGMRGVASGSGFYRHAGRQRRPNPRAASFWWAGPGEAWLSRTGLSHAEQLDLVQRRLTSLMVIEAFHCLREGVVDDAATLDFAMATSGWAPHRGGPVAYARGLGADAFLAQLEGLARDFGPRFTPPAGVREWLRAS
jgi:3-hydroxyacyl-CoA dehydrogenase/enoyl-CoA hydratase/3-hydroxybutyryl-CoA epimerase